MSSFKRRGLQQFLEEKQLLQPPVTILVPLILLNIGIIAYCMFCFPA